MADSILYGQKARPGRCSAQELIAQRTLMINQAREVFCQDKAKQVPKEQFRRTVRVFMNSVYYISDRQKGSSVTATPILPMCPRWSTEPRCASRKHGPSTEPCERLTASVSAPWRS
jgi:hypothetical protein